jgi:hypothetical protein
MRLLQGKSLQARRRIAIIATGCITFILILVMIYNYVYPPKITRDPVSGIVTIYTTIIDRVQMLFHRK